PGGLAMLAYGFEREGCAVTGISDAGHAAEFVRSKAPQLAVISLREPQGNGLDLIKSLRSGQDQGLPLVTFGPADLKPAALAPGASDFLPTPLFVRDVVNIGKLLARAGTLPAEPRTGDDEAVVEVVARLSEYHGLFYLLRAMMATGRSGVLVLGHGGKK